MNKEGKWIVKREFLGFSLGKLEERNRPHLRAPRGIAVDEGFGIMYVCDMFGNNIHVFNMEGEHVTSFGNSLLGKPWGILLYGDVLFVTDVGRHSVIKFRDFVHEEVNQIPFTFKFPRGMSITNKTNELFITDEDNHRVVACCTEPLRYSRVFATNIPSPYDVCICNQTDIVYVLNSNSPYIFKFSLSGELLAKLFHRKDMLGPWFFCLSLNLGLFVFSDYKTNQITILDREERMLQLIKQFSNSVFGVVLTSDLKLIVGSYDETHKIKIFQLDHKK